MNKKDKLRQQIELAKAEYFNQGGTIKRIDNEEFNQKSQVTFGDRYEFFTQHARNNPYLAGLKMCQRLMNSEFCQ